MKRRTIFIVIFIALISFNIYLFFVINVKLQKDLLFLENRGIALQEVLAKKEEEINNYFLGKNSKVLTQSQVNKIREGMTKNEVSEIIGNGFSDKHVTSFLPALSGKSFIDANYYNCGLSDVRCISWKKDEKEKMIVDFLFSGTTSGEYYSSRDGYAFYNSEIPNVIKASLPNKRVYLISNDDEVIPIHILCSFTSGAQPMIYELEIMQENNLLKTVEAEYPRFCIYLAEGRYKWRVRAKNYYGIGKWNAYSDFMIYKES